MLPRTCIALALAAWYAPALRAQDVTAIMHGEVIDGNGGPPMADGVVLVRGERIIAVGPAKSVAVPPGARVIDARGKAVLPGLADLHVHLLGGWDGENADMLGYQRYLNALLYAGVTTILDTGNSLPFIQQLRQEVTAGRIPGPAIHMAGPVVDGPDPVWPPISIAIASAAQIPGYVKQLKQARVDVVKGYVGLSEPALRALVRAAAAESLRVIVDAGDRNGTAVVARTGIAAFAHLGTVPVTDETVALMRDQHIASITTLAVYEAFSRRRLADLGFMRQPLLQQTMPPAFVAELTTSATRPLSGRDSLGVREAERDMRVAMANAKRLVNAGILLAAGTDAPYPGDYYGEGLHRELELLVEAGLMPLQAITLATKNAALFLREGAKWGTLEPGKRADVLIVAGDPARRIGDTRNVELVMQAGRVLDRVSLRFDPAKDPGFRATAPVMPSAP
jgi:imidazolonepropionase-like amidohydrolase